MFEQHHRKRTWGFRFSPGDAAALVLFGAAVAILHRLPVWLIILTGAFRERAH
jgi:hypothetical protein